MVYHHTLLFAIHLYHFYSAKTHLDTHFKEKLREILSGMESIYAFDHKALRYLSELWYLLLSAIRNLQIEKSDQMSIIKLKKLVSSLNSLFIF